MATVARPPFHPLTAILAERCVYGHVQIEETCFTGGDIVHNGPLRCRAFAADTSVRICMLLGWSPAAKALVSM